MGKSNDFLYIILVKCAYHAKIGLLMFGIN